MNLSWLLDKDGITLTNDAIEKLEQFATLLNQWNKIHNLTGARNIDEIYLNIIDSLYPITFLNPPTRLLDVGTGAGFPGLVLAIAWSDSKTILCEPLTKRVSFLKYVALELELSNIKVARDRVENLDESSFDLISSRAVTDTSLLMQLTQHLSNDDTSYIFYKGSRVFDELQALENQQNYDIVQKNKRNYLWIHK